MACLNPVRLAALAIFPLCLTSASYAENFPVLSLTEQSQMDLVLLQYMAAHHGTCTSSGDFDCYVVLQGQIPSQAFLDGIGLPSGRLKPWSAADAAKADPKKNFIGSGHNVLRLNIGGFSMIAPDTAHATVQEQCGTALCGSVSTATMKKANGGWTVTDYKVDMMQ